VREEGARFSVREVKENQIKRRKGEDGAETRTGVTRRENSVALLLFEEG